MRPNPITRAALSCRRRRSRLGAGTTGAALVACCVSLTTVSAAEPGGLLRRDFARHRPANFYESVYDQAPEVCGPLLASLNKEFRNSPSEKASIQRNDFLSKAWKQGKYTWRRPSADQDLIFTWDVVIADLNGDGVVEGVFRRRGWFRENDFETLYVESPAKKDVLEGTTLSLRRAREIIKSHKDAPPTVISVASPWTTPKDWKL